MVSAVIAVAASPRVTTVALVSASGVPSSGYVLAGNAIFSYSSVVGLVLMGIPSSGGFSLVVSLSISEAVLISMTLPPLQALLMTAMGVVGGGGNRIVGG